GSRVHRDLRSHGANHVREGHVTLYALAARALDAQRPTTDRAQGHKVRSGRSIAFDRIFARRTVGSARRNDEALPSVTRHAHAEALHQIQGDQNIWARDKLTVNFDDD